MGSRTTRNDPGRDLDLGLGLGRGRGKLGFSARLGFSAGRKKRRMWELGFSAGRKKRKMWKLDCRAGMHPKFRLSAALGATGRRCGLERVQYPVQICPVIRGGVGFQGVGDVGGPFQFAQGAVNGGDVDGAGWAVWIATIRDVLQVQVRLVA